MSGIRMTDERHEWVSVSEAVGKLGKSERTIRRWITRGRLPSRDGVDGLEVDIAGKLPLDDRPESGESQAPPDLAGQVAELQAEVRHLQAMLEAVTGERDYLRQAHAAALGTQRLLVENASAARSRPWWRFWERDSDSADR